ncbi:MAG: copper transporter [Firmicutes bacterium]|nr:copper transporter [Bacillota bacterium]
MHPGFRYHVASLLAVFFSLILGILIGGAVFPDHALVEEQAQLISDLEERFRDSSVKLAALQAELEFSSQAWLQLKASVARNLLAGQSVVIVGEGEVPWGSVLKEAGAQVETVSLHGLGQMPLPEDVVVVFSLGGEALSAEEREIVQALAAAGTRLGFVWSAELEPKVADLPPSLQVDSIDTSMGEIAFLLALAANAQGHYGLQKNAQGLFP